MAGLTASVDTTKTPLELNIGLSAELAEKRSIHDDITVLGETVAVDALFPIKVVDAERTWTLKSDSGTTAVYTAAA